MVVIFFTGTKEWVRSFFVFCLSFSPLFLSSPFVQRVDAEPGLQELDVELFFFVFVFRFEVREKSRRQKRKTKKKKKKNSFFLHSPSAATPSPARLRTGASWSRRCASSRLGRRAVFLFRSEQGRKQEGRKEKTGERKKEGREKSQRLRFSLSLSPSQTQNLTLSK